MGLHRAAEQYNVQTRLAQPVASADEPIGRGIVVAGDQPHPDPPVIQAAQLALGQVHQRR